MLLDGKLQIYENLFHFKGLVVDIKTNSTLR